MKTWNSITIKGVSKYENERTNYNSNKKLYRRVEMNKYKVCELTVRRAIKNGDLPVKRVGKKSIRIIETRGV